MEGHIPPGHFNNEIDRHSDAINSRQNPPVLATELVPAEDIDTDTFSLPAYSSLGIGQQNSEEEVSQLYENPSPDLCAETSYTTVDKGKSFRQLAPQMQTQPSADLPIKVNGDVPSARSVARSKKWQTCYDSFKEADFDDDDEARRLADQSVFHSNVGNGIECMDCRSTGDLCGQFNHETHCPVVASAQTPQNDEVCGHGNSVRQQPFRGGAYSRMSSNVQAWDETLQRDRPAKGAQGGGDRDTSSQPYFSAEDSAQRGPKCRRDADFQSKFGTFSKQSPQALALSGAYSRMSSNVQAWDETLQRDRPAKGAQGGGDRDTSSQPYFSAEDSAQRGPKCRRDADFQSKFGTFSKQSPQALALTGGAYSRMSSNVQAWDETLQRDRPAKGAQGGGDRDTSSQPYFSAEDSAQRGPKCRRDADFQSKFGTFSKQSPQALALTGGAYSRMSSNVQAWDETLQRDRPAKGAQGGGDRDTSSQPYFSAEDSAQRGPKCRRDADFQSKFGTFSKQSPQALALRGRAAARQEPAERQSPGHSVLPAHVSQNAVFPPNIGRLLDQQNQATDRLREQQLRPEIVGNEADGIENTVLKRSQGEGHLCKCFCCGGGMRGWVPNDKPLDEHVRLHPNCACAIRKKEEPNQELVQNTASGSQNIGDIDRAIHRLQDDMGYPRESVSLALDQYRRRVQDGIFSRSDDVTSAIVEILTEMQNQHQI